MFSLRKVRTMVMCLQWPLGVKMYTFTETTLILINRGKVYFQAFKIRALLQKHWGKQTVHNFFLKAGWGWGGGGGGIGNYTWKSHTRLLKNQAFLVEIRGGSINFLSPYSVPRKVILGLQNHQRFSLAHYLRENTIISTINDTPFAMITKSAKEIIKDISFSGYSEIQV